MNILIAGYPYVRENYRRTFDFYPEKDKVFFLLPKVWKVKMGKVVYRPPQKESIFTTKTLFHHSGYPIIGGLLKGWMPLFPYKLFKIHKEKGIDLVYNCNEPTLLATLYNAIWAKLFGLKNVIFSWENVPFNRKFRGIKGITHNIILKLNLSFSDGMVCGNTRCLKIFKKLTSKPLSLIPLSGLDEQFFRPDPNLKKSQEITFIFAGAISYRKGIHVILRAFRNLLSIVPKAKLIIVGSGELDEQINNEIDRLGLRENTEKIPWVNHRDLLGILNKSDVFLYPSIAHKGWEEQFGYSIAEASLCELPIIATRSGSIGGVVIDNKTGILIQENNVRELEKAMIKLADDGEMRRTLGKAGREYIIKNFSHKVVASKFFAFFHGYKTV